MHMAKNKTDKHPELKINILQDNAIMHTKQPSLFNSAQYLHK